MPKVCANMNNVMSKDFIYTGINQLWKIIAGPLVLLFIPLFLTPIEQGYWYTFTSIAALAVFADLGFSVIILQFAAHEFAYLQFTSDRTIVGNEEHVRKLASFFRFSVTWLIRAIVIVFPVIIVGGYFFVSSKNELSNWEVAWFLYALSSALVFFYSSLFYFFEGCNSVALVQSMRLKVSVCTSGTILIGLYEGMTLYALALSLIVSGILGCILLFIYFAKTIKQLWQLSKQDGYNWWPEFSNLIWRYAISWCSGYFIFQLFTPLAFAFHGSVFAGKVGISIAAWTAGFAISTTWITAVTPKLNMLIAEHEWNALDKLFNSNLIRSMLTMLTGGGVYFLFCFLLSDQIGFFTRLLDPTSMFVLFLCWLGQLFINDVAVYLRSHKKEPLMPLSFVSAIYVSVTTLLCAKYLSDTWLFLGFLTSYCLGIPIVIYIWKKQKREHRMNNGI